MATITPEAPALIALITKIKEAEPGLGIKKVLSQIQTQEPTWLVSEKRVKKLMSEAGIATAVVELEVDESIPVSHIDTTVDVGTLTKGLVKAKMINKVIGKGLFAAQDIPKDTVLFTEFPFIYAPPMKRFNMILSGDACGLCARSIKFGNVLICACPACSRVKYCTKACRQTAWDSFHRVECLGMNPNIKEYINHAVEEDWMAAIGALRCYERILIANETSPEELDSVIKHLDAFATISQEERQKKDTAWDMMGSVPAHALWDKSVALLIKGLKFPLKSTGKAGVPALTKPLPKKLEETLFTKDTFLKFVGRYNLNNQAGGMYLLHASLNHACMPNTAVDHPAAGTNYGVSIRLARDVKRDEQLQITYCNPMWKKDARQEHLRTEYQFTCKCKRCTGSDDTPGDDLLRALGFSA
ncbi:SET domain-containing protein 5 [Podila epicladia]|nr:SET domain-containing protein 5 [Podila epicladia]KAG0092107.1 SET domain-containing protein 5 [Podila epicladia]